jgi:hypothetical protein
MVQMHLPVSTIILTSQVTTKAIEVVDKPTTATPANDQQTKTNNMTQKKTEDYSK